MTKFASILLMASPLFLLQTDAKTQEIAKPYPAASMASLPDSTKKDTLVYTPFKGWTMDGLWEPL